MVVYKANNEKIALFCISCKKRKIIRRKKDYLNENTLMCENSRQIDFSKVANFPLELGPKLENPRQSPVDN